MGYEVGKFHKVDHEWTRIRVGMDSWKGLQRLFWLLGLAYQYIIMICSFLSYQTSVSICQCTEYRHFTMHYMYQIQMIRTLFCRTTTSYNATMYVLHSKFGINAMAQLSPVQYICNYCAMLATILDLCKLGIYVTFCNLSHLTCIQMPLPGILNNCCRTL